MISSTDVALLLSGWRDDAATVKALLIDEDRITRSVIEGTISKLDNALMTISNARNYMFVNLVNAQFDYGDSREMDEYGKVYSDLLNGRLDSGLYFAIAVVKSS